MDLSLKPETADYIAEEIKAGRFASPEELIEAALAEFRSLAESPLDAQTIAAINEGLDQANRGEGIELNDFRRQFFKDRAGR